MEKGRRLTNMEIERDRELSSVVAILGSLGIQKLLDTWGYIEKNNNLHIKFTLEQYNIYNFKLIDWIYNILYN